MKLVSTEFKLGRLHEKHVVATWNVGNHLSAFAYRNRETKENLCRCLTKRQFYKYENIVVKFMYEFYGCDYCVLLTVNMEYHVEVTFIQLCVSRNITST